MKFSGRILRAWQFLIIILTHVAVRLRVAVRAAAGGLLLGCGVAKAGRERVSGVGRMEEPLRRMCEQQRYAPLSPITYARSWMGVGLMQGSVGSVKSERGQRRDIVRAVWCRPPQSPRVGEPRGERYVTLAPARPVRRRTHLLNDEGAERGPHARLHREDERHRVG